MRTTIGSTSIPLVLAALVSLLAAPAGTVSAQETSEDATPAAIEESEAPVKTIKMTGENWKWTPKVIRVEQGTRLRIEFQSWDASHSFVLKAYGIKVPLPEDSTRHVEFVVDKKGEFKWKCGRPCGDGCAKMVGKLIVE